MHDGGEVLDAFEPGQRLVGDGGGLACAVCVKFFCFAQSDDQHARCGQPSVGVEQGGVARLAVEIAAGDQGLQGAVEGGVDRSGGAPWGADPFKQIDHETIGGAVGDIPLNCCKVHTLVPLVKTAQVWV
jgi:hypothetical protein